MPKKIKPLPSLEALLTHFELAPDLVTGLRWKVPTAACMKAGDMAGGVGQDGYTRVRFLGETYKTARIVLFLHTKEDHPELEADHIDRNPLNNNYINLRWATTSVQQKNRKWFTSYPKKGNNTGCKNIYYHKKTKTYAACVTRNGKRLKGPERPDLKTAQSDLQNIFYVLQQESNTPPS